MSDQTSEITEPAAPRTRTVDREIAEASDRLHRFFVSSFVAGDIALPLPTFDASIDDSAVAEVMRRRAFRVAGICRDGLVSDYLSDPVAKGTADDAPGALSRLPIEVEQIVHSDTSLTVVVEKLAVRDILFVSSFGNVSGVVVRDCLHKPPGRMWLFGIITLLEMRALIAVDLLYPQESWREVISPGRLEKAVTLQNERLRRGQTCSLLDCLQLTDKVDLLGRSPVFSEALGTVSKRQFKDVMKGMESLRNNLAHAQDFIPGDWSTVVLLVSSLEERLLNPKLRHLSAGSASGDQKTVSQGDSRG